MPDPIRSGSVSKPVRIPDFAPDDHTDGRELLEWRSRYPEPEAQRNIRFEAIYLACHLVIIPVIILILWLGYPKNWLGLSDQRYERVLKYGLAWLIGILGGTTFGVKWLYHSVARQIWHMDRRLWRLFTPHIGGVLAFAIVVLISSGILRIFDPKAAESLPLVVGVAFLGGYFSDSTAAKLAEVAQSLFGASQAKEKHRDGSMPGNGGQKPENLG